MFSKIQQYAKAIVSLVGAILTAGAFTLPDEAQPWVGLVLAILTAIATYAVPNKPDTTPGVNDALVKGDGLGGEDEPKHAA